MMEIVVRSIVLSLAWFAALNLVASAVSAVASAILLRRPATVRPRLLLVLRLLPSVGSFVFAIAMFLPIQWVLEPRDAAETLGLVWYVLAAAGAGLLARSAGRTARIARLSRIMRRGARPCPLASNIDEVDGLPGVSLAGILQPRILVGRKVTTELTAAELDVAIAHEMAHRDAHDNLARWGMACAPDFLSGSRVAQRLEHDWHVAAESRADAVAVRGDRVRAVHLASALIKVARLSAAWSPAMPVAVWSTLNDSDLLERRVRHLVNDALPVAEPLGGWGSRTAVGLVAVMIALPAVAAPIHRVTEALVAFLP
jgi:hypothetical protein